MSHLQRRYTDYFYVQRGKGEKARLQKKTVYETCGLH